MHDLDGRRQLIEQEEVVAQLLAGLLNAGLSTSDVIALGRSAAVKLGLDAVEFVDLGRSVLIQHGHPDGQIRTVSRPVGLDSINCEQLRALTLVCKQISAGKLDIQTAPNAIQRAAAITANKWRGVIGLTILAFCIALQVGAGWMTALGASLVQVSVSLMGWIGWRIAIPRLFVVALQCMVCAIVAAGLVVTGLVASPGAVAIAVAWMLLVPQPQVINMVIDAINTLQLAALARFASVAVAVGGILVGGAAVIHIGRQFVDAVPDPTLLSLPLPLALFFSLIGAMANAVANGGRMSLMLPAGVVGLLTAICNQFLTRGLEMHTAWAAGISAVLLGLVATFLARKSSYPASVLALMGMTAALLPGLTVYMGLATSLTGVSGIAEYLQAALICVVLGVGVALGFTIARLILRKPHWEAQ